MIMARATSLELLAFNLKLLGPKSQKQVLVSAGKMEDKKRVLPALQRFQKLNVKFFATPGTYAFLSENGVPATEIHKISEEREPNIETFLTDNKLDLVI